MERLYLGITVTSTYALVTMALILGRCRPSPVPVAVMRSTLAWPSPAAALCAGAVIASTDLFIVNKLPSRSRVIVAWSGRSLHCATAW